MVWIPQQRGQAMGNCSEKCSYCDCLNPTLVQKWRPKLLDVMDQDSAAAAAAPGSCGGGAVSSRQKVDGRSSSFDECCRILEQRLLLTGAAAAAAQVAGIDQDEGAPAACEVESMAEDRSGLQIYVVTWNMNGKMPEANLARFLVDATSGRRYDLYAIGLQEAPSWFVESFFLEILGESYCFVASSVMASLQLFVFARITLLPFISDPKSDRVGVGGLGGVVGRQKGAVAISLRYRDFTFLFLSCHLAPHEGNVEARNAQFMRICQSIFARPSAVNVCSCLQTTTGVVANNLGLKQHSLNTVEESDLVIWIGDLNYRVVGQRSSVGVLIKNDLEKLLWPRDQLSREVQRGKVFNGFVEGPLTFRPTYKYDIGTDNYDTSTKERVPSWTDRILFKVRPRSWITAAIHNYDSVDAVKSSDHRPVKALLRVNLII